jgi:hypothetical protein
MKAITDRGGRSQWKSLKKKKKTIQGGQDERSSI